MPHSSGRSVSPEVILSHAPSAVSSQIFNRPNEALLSSEERLRAKGVCHTKFLYDKLTCMTYVA